MKLPQARLEENCKSLGLTGDRQTQQNFRNVVFGDHQERKDGRFCLSVLTVAFTPLKIDSKDLDSSSLV